MIDVCLTYSNQDSTYTRWADRSRQSAHHENVTLIEYNWFEKRTSLGHTWTETISQGSSPLFVMLNGDDFLLPAFHSNTKTIESNTFFQSQVCSSDGFAIRPFYPPSYQYTVENHKNHFNAIHEPAVIVRSQYETVLPFILPYIEDPLFDKLMYLALGLAFGWKYDPTPAMGYRVHSNNLHKQIRQNLLAYPEHAKSLFEHMRAEGLC